VTLQNIVMVLASDNSNLVTILIILSSCVIE